MRRKPGPSVDHGAARRACAAAPAPLAGQTPLATRTGYAASKHALHGFFESLRAEHAREGLGVLMVCPSFVKTRIGAHAFGPDGRPAPPEARTGVDADALAPAEVAEAVLHALAKGWRVAYVPWRARLYVWLARVAPGFFERRMGRRMLGRSHPTPGDAPREGPGAGQARDDW